MAHGSTTRSVGEAALHGALAGMAGWLALVLTEQTGRHTIMPIGSDTTSGAARAAEAVASSHDIELSRPAAEALGGSGELVWCASLGALFGIVHNRVQPPPLLHGLVLAGIALGVTHSSRGIVPRLGLTPPIQQSVEEVVIAVSAHVAFGVTTAAVYEATS